MDKPEVEMTYELESPIHMEFKTALTELLNKYHPMIHSQILFGELSFQAGHILHSALHYTYDNRK